jgi:Transposase DDE domain
LHHRLLDWLGDDGQVDWSRAAIDSVSVRARRGELSAQTRSTGGKPGSKYHLLIDATGLPLAVGLSAANTHDSQLLERLVDAVPAVIGPRGRPGRPRKRPAKLHGDRATTTRAAGGCCAGAGSARGSRARKLQPL